MNTFDILIGLTIVGFACLGWIHGPAREILTFSGLAFGALWAFANPSWFEFLSDSYNIPPPLGIILAVFFCSLAGWFLGRVVSAFLPPLSPWSPWRALAGLVGATKGVAIACVAYWFILRFQVSVVSTGSSLSAPWLEKVLHHSTTWIGLNI